MSRTFSNVGNTLAFIAVLGYNYYVLRTIGVVNLLAIVFQYRIYILPIDATYYVWAAIYVYLFGYIVLQWIYQYSQNPDVRIIDGWFPASCVAYIGWLYFFTHLNYPQSTLFMFFLLLTLIVSYNQLKVGLSKRSKESRESKNIIRFIHYPFSMYLAWITIIGFINFAYTLSVIHFESITFWGHTFSGPDFAVVIMGFGAILALILLMYRNDYAYTFVIIWWLFGLSLSQTDVPLVSNTSTGVAAFLSVVVLIKVIRSQKPVKTYNFG